MASPVKAWRRWGESASRLRVGSECGRLFDERDRHAFFCAGTGSQSSSFDQFRLL